MPISPHLGQQPIEEYDDNSAVFLSSYAGGAHPLKLWGSLDLRFVGPDGTEMVRSYVATGPARPFDLQPASASFGTAQAAMRRAQAILDEMAKPRPWWLRLRDRLHG